MFTANAQAGGALTSGSDAAATGRGGTVLASSGDPLAAVEGNPAGLAGITRPSLNLGGKGLLPSGSFRNSVDQHGYLQSTGGAMAFFALAGPLPRASRTIAVIAITPEALLRASWRYIDPPGTAGASYGLQTNESQIVALRTSFGLARSFGSRWAAGGTLGLVYNSNHLNAPYIFQQQPQLAGLKVLLHLVTSGFGWNGSAGAQWQPSSSLRLGAAWKSGTWIATHGQAYGTASAQFAALGITADPVYHYRATVATRLPPSAGLGATWKQNSRLAWSLDGSWTGWQAAFRQLPITLSQGSNATINSLTGPIVVDSIPLHWRNQGGVRFGAEVPLRERWTVRGGYAYMSNPVPSATLTPVTAAILRNSLTTGAGWSRGRTACNLAYQVQLPTSQSVDVSTLQAGEYSGTRVQVMTQSLTITLHVRL